MSWGYVAAAAATVIGGALSADASKDAAKKSKKGSTAELEFARESRDLIRSDQAPYIEAGHTALDALMSLTGLGGGRAVTPSAPRVSAIAETTPNVPAVMSKVNPSSRNRRISMFARYDGGPMYPDTYYNVSEIEPENVYEGESYRRVSRPTTIKSDGGYVEPNIEGRFLGGLMTKHSVDMFGGKSRRKRSRRLNRLEEQVADLQSANTDSYGTAVTGSPASADTTAINPATGFPYENPGGVEGGYNFQTDPGYQFRFEEGMRALDRSAAARGGFLSGGFARKAIRFGQDYATNEYTNVYNRIANIAGLGQVSAANLAGSTMTGTAIMGNAASNAANASAYGDIGAANAWANTINELGQIDWGTVFNRDG